MTPSCEADHVIASEQLLPRPRRPVILPLLEASLDDLPPQVAGPGYDRAALRPGIVHVGVGNFHRTHLAVYVDRCLRFPGQEAWGIVGVGINPGPEGEAKARAYAAQDNLYTVTEHGADGRTGARVIGAMIGYLHAPSNPAEVIAAMAAPDARIVSLTITEGGYAIAEATGEFDLTNSAVAADLAGGEPPRTVFRLVAEAMRARRNTGLGGVTILSCDNLRSNGAVTRTAFLGFARAWDPDTAAWMEANCSFPNSMVDRIAIKVGPEERARANAFTGLDDALPAIAEDFIQWVVEDDFAAGRPDLEAVGVELRPDVHAFEAIKVRMINGAHMMMAYPALLIGHRRVDAAMADPRIAALLRQFLDRVAIPLVTPPEGVSTDAYRDMILRRFANPAIGDQVLRLAHDGVSKLPIYLAATTRETLAATGDPSILAFHMACFRQYFARRDDAGVAFEVNEPQLSPADAAVIATGDPLAFLGITPFAPLRLVDNIAFREAYLEAVRAVEQVGANETLDRLVRASA